MTPAKKIVVGVDGSTGSTRALLWAIRQAEAAGGSVQAVIAWEYPPLALLPGPFGYAVPPPEAMQAAKVDLLAAQVATARASTTVPIDEVVRRGFTADVLLEQAKEADLLVVGTRGRGGMTSVVLGSVSRKVAAAAPCPVAVVPDDRAVDETRPVVVAVDGSAGSMAALRWAGASTDRPIRAVHAFEYPFGPEYVVGEFQWEDPEALGQKLVEHCVDEAIGDRDDVTLDVVRGDPRKVLVEAAGDASMIVMGSRGATGFQGWLLGSVTTAVAGHAAVPVVMVPPD